jgi:hypothetical protein
VVPWGLKRSVLATASTFLETESLHRVASTDLESWIPYRYAKEV